MKQRETNSKELRFVVVERAVLYARVYRKSVRRSAYYAESLGDLSR